MIRAWVAGLGTAAACSLNGYLANRMGRAVPFFASHSAALVLTCDRFFCVGVEKTTFHIVDVQELLLLELPFFQFDGMGKLLASALICLAISAVI